MPNPLVEADRQIDEFGLGDRLAVDRDELRNRLRNIQVRRLRLPIRRHDPGSRRDTEYQNRLVRQAPIAEIEVWKFAQCGFA